MILPYGRNREVILGRKGQEILRQIQNAGIVGEIPFAAEQQEALRICAALGQRAFAAAVGNEIRVIGHRAHMQCLKILMEIEWMHGGFSLR